MDDRTARNVLRRHLPSRSDLIDQCVAISNSLRSKSSNRNNQDTVTPANASEIAMTGRKPLKLHKSSTVNFDWWNDSFDVIKQHEATLPSSVRPDPLILTQERNTLNETCSQLTEVGSKKRRISSNERTPLPKLYYKAWPMQTHKLNFPFHEFYKFPEISAAALSDYKSRLQSDDSIELGLRIIAHINQESTPLTIIPSTKVWNILSRSKIRTLDPTSLEIRIVANDLRRKTCPYIDCNVGLTPGFSTMMISQSHWYAILLVGSDKLIKGLRQAMTSVSDRIGSETTPSQQMLMEAYSEELVPSAFPEVAVVVVDSIGVRLSKAEWDMLQNFLFICIMQSLGLILHTAGCDSKKDIVSTLDSESQELHLVCASIQAVIHILWPFRLQISGPKQPDNRTCGAYGLASISMLSTAEGFNSMSNFVKDSFNEKNSSKRSRKTTATRRTPSVPMGSYTDFYNDDYMHTVMRSLDNFIRTEVVTRK